MVEQNIKVYKVDKKLQSNEILEFCKFANSFVDDPAHVNMYHKYWQDHPETLPIFSLDVYSSFCLVSLCACVFYFSCLNFDCRFGYT